MILEPDAAVINTAKWLQWTIRDADLIYSDEDKLTDEGLDSPIFKPDWSPDYFLVLQLHLPLHPYPRRRA